MRRFCHGLLLTLALSACRIEQTPQRFIDHQTTPAEEIAASEEELRGRLGAMISALQRRNLAEAAAALQVHADAQVIGPGEGQKLSDAGAIAAVLSELAGPGPGAADEISVAVGPRNNVAWFYTEYSAVGDTDERVNFRFSGVLLRQEGAWRLVEGHISRPISPPPPQPAADGTPVGV